MKADMTQVRRGGYRVAEQGSCFVVLGPDWSKSGTFATMWEATAVCVALGK